MSAKKVAPEIFNARLIKEVRRYPYLYDANHRQYGDLKKKKKTWCTIGATLSQKPEFLKTRWRTLRDRYTRERRRLQQEGGPPSFSNFKQMEFIEEFIREPTSPKKASKGETSERSAEDVNSFMDCTESEVRNDSSGEKEDAPSPVIGSTFLNTTGNSCFADNNDVQDTFDFGIGNDSMKEEEPLVSSWEIKEALLRSADALTHFAEQEANTQTTPVKDSDEFFVDYVLSAVREIDVESRPLARIAIIQALAQFQT